MKDSVLVDIGAKEPRQDWASIDWQKTKKRVKNLRQRIYRARRLEPDEGKPSFPVLRGGSSGDARSLTRPTTLCRQSCVIM
ncbi:MAG: reverse transcriptase N-terminal domain-containing protein [Nitrososphaera sp.]|nr:reverse transcriptase N-terminal domain-containing protein [Nitrososphaera sp.]